MDFIDFCRVHGIVIDNLPPIGRWVRLPTESHPRKRNGAVKYMGDHGFVQDHANMQEVALWRGERTKVDMQAVRQAARQERQKLELGRKEASSKAQWIVKQCRLATHPYLERKGFPELQGLVWERRDARLLVVPMRIDGVVCGVQLISEDGTKKFLKGQASQGATFTMGYPGVPRVWCEGYATALSVHKAASLARLRVQVVAAFSAHNLQVLAKDGHIVADNDPKFAGEMAAKAAGRPYWISPVCGEDFNDFMLRVGPFQASRAIAELVRMT